MNVLLNNNSRHHEYLNKRAMNVISELYNLGYQLPTFESLNDTADLTEVEKAVLTDASKIELSVLKLKRLTAKLKNAIFLRYGHVDGELDVKSILALASSPGGFKFKYSEHNGNETHLIHTMEYEGLYITGEKIDNGCTCFTITAKGTDLLKRINKIQSDS